MVGRSNGPVETSKMITGGYHAAQYSEFSIEAGYLRGFMSGESTAEATDWSRVARATRIEDADGFSVSSASTVDDNQPFGVIWYRLPKLLTTSEYSGH